MRFSPVEPGFESRTRHMSDFFSQVAHSNCDIAVKNRVISKIYHHRIDRKKVTVLQGYFGDSEFTRIKSKMGVGGFLIGSPERAAKYKLKIVAKGNQLAILWGLHWQGSKNYLKTRKILTNSLQFSFVEV